MNVETCIATDKTWYDGILLIFFFFYFPLPRSNWTFWGQKTIFGVKHVSGDYMVLWTSIPDLKFRCQSRKQNREIRVEQSGNRKGEAQRQFHWPCVITDCKLFSVCISMYMVVDGGYSSYLFRNDGCDDHWQIFKKVKFKLSKHPLTEYELIHYDPWYFMSLFFSILIVVRTPPF